MKAFKGPAKQRGFLGLISLAISAVGAIGKAAKERSANKSARAGARDEQAIRAIRNLQHKRKFVKDLRLAQAIDVAAGGGTEGGLDSSRVQGQLAASTTQGKVGLADQNDLADLDASAQAHSLSAAKARNQGALIGTVANLASTAASKFGGGGDDDIGVPSGPGKAVI